MKRSHIVKVCPKKVETGVGTKPEELPITDQPEYKKTKTSFSLTKL